MKTLILMPMNAPSRSSSAATRPNLTQVALDAIRDRIVEGEFEFGAAISEAALAEVLGISKTPVREALLQLKREGLVDVYPKRGTFVFDVRTEDVDSICEFRRLLECAALQNAASRSWGQLVDRLGGLVRHMQAAVENEDLPQYRQLDAQFHSSFFEFCGNPFLVDAYDLVRFRVQALRSRLSARNENNRITSAEHAYLLSLIEQRRIEAALELLTQHIARTRASYLALLSPSHGQGARR